MPGEENQEIRSDFDSPWKEALERYLHPFLTLCFPRVEASIDWQRPVEFVDKELQAVMRDAESGEGFKPRIAGGHGSLNLEGMKAGRETR